MAQSTTCAPRFSDENFIEARRFSGCPGLLFFLIINNGVSRLTAMVSSVLSRVAFPSRDNVVMQVACSIAGMLYFIMFPLCHAIDLLVQ